jgi:succinoglycan biosynthesis protein ExoM
MSIDDTLISVCICTFRRPGVADTVKSIFAQTAVANIEVIVCDDDEAGSAQQWILPLLKDAPFPLRYVPCGSRNVSICRNKCIAVSHGKWIAFIDDDEIAEPNWLCELLVTQAKYNADVVKGFVRGVYPPGTPRWITKGDPFTRDFGPSGTPLTWFGAGNVMFRRALVVKHELRFNRDHGLIGGEDTDFFRRVRQCGARMVACRTAIVNEMTPPERVKESYLRRRFRRQGQVEAVYRKARARHFVRLTHLLKYLLNLIRYGTYPALRPLSERWSFKMFHKFWFYIGMLECSLGRQPFTIERDIV